MRESVAYPLMRWNATVLMLLQRYFSGVDVFVQGVGKHINKSEIRCIASNEETYDLQPDYDRTCRTLRESYEEIGVATVYK